MAGSACPCPGRCLFPNEAAKARGVWWNLTPTGGPLSPLPIRKPPLMGRAEDWPPVRGGTKPCQRRRCSFDVDVLYSLRSVVVQPVYGPDQVGGRLLLHVCTYSYGSIHLAKRLGPPTVPRCLGTYVCDAIRAHHPAAIGKPCPLVTGTLRRCVFRLQGQIHPRFPRTRCVHACRALWSSGESDGRAYGGRRRGLAVNADRPRLGEDTYALHLHCPRAPARRESGSNRLVCDLVTFPSRSPRQVRGGGQAGRRRPGARQAESDLTDGVASHESLDKWWLGGGWLGT